MDNMIPKASWNNEETGTNLEEYRRSLASAGNEIYVIMGSYGTGDGLRRLGNDNWNAHQRLFVKRRAVVRI